MTAGETSDGGRVLVRLAKQLEVCLASHDLSLSQYRMLFLLDEGSAAASSLADRLAVSRPSVTAVVDGLVSRGLVERKPELGDRRRVSHALTEEGRRVLEAADTAASDRLWEIAGHVDVDEGAAAFAGLEAWRHALDAQRAKREAARRHDSTRITEIQREERGVG